MIRDYNIAEDANIAMHKLALGGTVFGDRFYVDYANGCDTGTDGKSKSAPFKTLSRAYDAAASNHNDVIFVNGYSTVVETAMIDWSKNRIHVIGDNGAPPIFGAGAGAKIQIGVTTDTDDIALLKVTGVRNTFSNIKFDSANTLTQAAYCVADGGEYTRFHNCEFYKSIHLTTAGAAELLCNGDSSEYVHCTFGDLVNAKGGSGAPRANVLVSRTTITVKVARDVTFYNCVFLQKALHVDANFVYGSGTTDVERRMIFVNPIFYNCILATATIADGITFGGAQTTGDVLLINPSGLNVTAFAEASQNVYVTGAVPTAATSGIAVEIAA